MVFGTAERLTETLTKLSKEQELEKKKPIKALPVISDLRLALNVAAADLRPLIVTYGKNKKEAQALREPVATLAWNPTLVGRALFVVLESEKDLEGFESLSLQPGVTVLQAEPYGRSGTVLAHAALPSKSEVLSKSLAQGMKAFDAEAKNVRKHIRQGASQGIDWEPAVPVTDKEAERKPRR